MVPGAAIDVRGNSYPNDTAQGTSDASGLVTFTNLTEGTYAVSASGTRLESGLSGRAVRFQCPYHAWIYELDGSLKRAPHTEDVNDFDVADAYLVDRTVVDRVVVGGERTPEARAHLHVRKQHLGVQVVHVLLLEALFWSPRAGDRLVRHDAVVPLVARHAGVNFPVKILEAARAAEDEVRKLYSLMACNLLGLSGSQLEARHALLHRARHADARSR